MVAEPAQRLFTVDEYERMIEAGIICSGERVELWDGRIVALAAMGARHIACITRSQNTLIATLGNRVLVRVQGPIRLPPDKEPEPDIVVVRFRDDDYVGGHPGPADIFLLIEVADSSFASDRRRKLPGYAAGIPETWIEDVVGDRILVHRQPRGAWYEQVFSVGRGEFLSPLAFPDVVLAVNDLLPVGQPS